MYLKDLFVLSPSTLGIFFTIESLLHNGSLTLATARHYTAPSPLYVHLSLWPVFNFVPCWTQAQSQRIGWLKRISCLAGFWQMRVSLLEGRLPMNVRSIADHYCLSKRIVVLYVVPIGTAERGRWSIHSCFLVLSSLRAWKPFLMVLPRVACTTTVTWHGCDSLCIFNPSTGIGIHQWHLLQ